jgi:diguanylate cyclase (GGDEF)-like protein
LSAADPGAKTARLTLQLRELHHLSTSVYESEADLYSAYLTGGRHAFAMPFGAAFGQDGVLIDGDSGFEPSLRVEVALNEHLMGAIAFGGAPASDLDSEVAEMMGRSLAHGVLGIRARREQKRLSQKLKWQAWHDPLTRLPNRARLGEWIESAIAKADETGRRMALVFIDLDRIKPVNDTLGHAVGDEILVAVGARIQSLLAPGNQAVRLGADEFVIIVRDISAPEEAAEIAGRLLETLRQPYPLSGYELFITASIGVSLYPDHGRDEKSLLQAADAAMYRAKNQGRNDYRIFTAELIAHALDRFELENQLRRALTSGELELLYQPILSVNGALDSLEVLLTWNSPRLGRLAAKQFINIAEETGMIVTIGPWVLRKACEQGARWMGQDRPIRIAVNVSGLEFARIDFVESVAATLQETGLPGSLLELEVTESTILLDVGDTAKSFSRLRELGVSLAIDDFGTGYSSLSYLRRLPVNALKIDQSFLSDLDANATSVPLVQAIVTMAHSIGMTVTAEGVETKDQLGILRLVGCDKAQGHFFGGALPAAEVEKLFARAPRL